MGTESKNVSEDVKEEEPPAPQEEPNDPPQKKSYSGFMDMINSEDESLFPNVVDLKVFGTTVPFNLNFESELGMGHRQLVDKKISAPPNAYETRNARVIRNEKKATQVDFDHDTSPASYHGQTRRCSFPLRPLDKRGKRKGKRGKRREQSGQRRIRMRSRNFSMRFSYFWPGVLWPSKTLKKPANHLK